MAKVNVFMNPEAGQIPEWTIFDRLRKAREWAGFEQSELAAASGISRATISSAENGHRAPSPMTSRLWALATGVPESWILTGVVPVEEGPDPVTHRYPNPVVSIDFARSVRELVSA